MSQLLYQSCGRLGIVTLNRPEALNALTLDMVDQLSSHLQDISSDPDIHAIFFKGAGDRAFCAGGDIKAVRLDAIEAGAGRIRFEKVVDFFVREYAINRELYHFKKSTIAFMNGITMGGGVGVAGACKYRIVTENTRWAMPEVSIGFFTDVGAAYYLARAPHHVGKYLGLTGATMSNPADLIKCGFATHFTAAAAEENLLRDLQKTSDIEETLQSFSTGAGTKSLPYDLIETCFAANSVEEIIENLNREESEWATETAATLKTKSPISLKITLRHIIRAERDTFNQVIDRDLKLAAAFMRKSDFIEGVRAMVVDKDRRPVWNPAMLEEIQMSQIERYFN